MRFVTVGLIATWLSAWLAASGGGGDRDAPDRPHDQARHHEREAGKNEHPSDLLTHAAPSRKSVIFGCVSGDVSGDALLCLR